MEKDLILSRAKSAGIARDFQTAIKLYKMILKDDASNTEILNQIGSSYVKLGEDEKALLYYEQIITFSPHDVDAMNSMGAIYRRLKRYKESITVLQKALDEDADTATVNYNLGFTYKEMGNYDDAISAFKSVVEEKPEDVLAHNHMGTIYYQKKDYQKSIACFRKGLQVDPNHPILQYNLAKCYEAENQFTEAVRCYEIALKARPGWLDALRDFSELLIKCQKTDEARNIVTRTIELNPNDARLYMLLGEVYLNEFDFDSAITTFNEADTLEENNIRILRDLADALEKGEQPQEAVDVMDKILKIDPENIDAQKQYVHTLLSAEEYERAYSQVDSLYNKNGDDDAQVLDLYGQYYICVDDDENAKKYFDKIPTVDPKYSLYLLEAANRYSQIGKIHQAEELAKKYITKNPTDVRGHNSLGSIYTKKGDTEAAGAAFQKGIEYLPNNAYAKKQLKRLDKIRVKAADGSPQSSVAVRSGDVAEEDKTFINTDISFDAGESDINFSDIITKAQKKYADEQTATMNAEDFPDNDMDIASFIEENGDVSVADLPEEEIVNEKDQYLDENSEKDLMKNDVNPNDFFADYPKSPSYPTGEDMVPQQQAPVQNEVPAEAPVSYDSGAAGEAMADDSTVSDSAEAQPMQKPFDRSALSTPEDYYNAATQAADMAMDAAEKALKSLQDIDEKFAEQEAMLKDKFAQQEEALERKTEELINRKDEDTVTDEGKAAEEEFLDLDGFMDMAENIDDAAEVEEADTENVETEDVELPAEESEEALDDVLADESIDVEAEEDAFPSLDDVLGFEENNKNLSEETSAEEEKDFENAETDIIIDDIPEEDSETISEGDAAVDETLDFAFDSVDSFIQEDKLIDDDVFDTVENILDFDSLEAISEPEEIDTLEDDVADELLAVDEESIQVNIVEEDAPFEDIISAAAEVAAESDLAKDQNDDNLDVLEEDVFSILDPMDTVRRYLPNIEKILQDTDYAHAHATELDLFIKMKKFCEFLPESELDHYKNSKIRMLLDYLIARLSGKPGLLVTTQSLLKAGVLGEGVWEQMYEKEVNLPFDEAVRIVLEYMKKMTEGLTSPHVAQALCAEADKVLEKLELKKL